MRQFKVFAQDMHSNRQIKRLIEANNEDDAVRIASQQLFQHDFYVTDINECDEIAHCMAINMDPPRFATLDEASAWVTAQMPDGTMTIRDNVAEALFSAQR